MGLITLGVTYTTGEITTFMPRTGGFVRHATHFVEPALGAAVGWNFCMSRQQGGVALFPTTHLDCLHFQRVRSKLTLPTIRASQGTLWL